MHYVCGVVLKQDLLLNSELAYEMIVDKDVLGVEMETSHIH